MKKYLAIASASLAGLVMQVQAAFAQCYLNGEEVPCEVLEEQMGNFLGAGLLIFGISLVIGVVAFIFWLLMIIHAASKPIDNKAVWIIVMVLTGVIGAIIYYFVVKRNFKDLPTGSPIMPEQGEQGGGGPTPSA